MASRVKGILHLVTQVFYLVVFISVCLHALTSHSDEIIVVIVEVFTTLRCFKVLMSMLCGVSINTWWI